MNKNLFVMTAAIMLTIPLNGLAEQYARTVTVAGTGGNFTSPVKALASITDASASKPVLIKVMPGTYDLGTSSLQMKQYVDIEGAGADKTVLTSANFNTDANSCAVATVIMAPDAILRSVKIVNSALTSPTEAYIVGVAFNDVAAKAEGIKVLVGADEGYNAGKWGICSAGPSGQAMLSNVDIEVRDGSHGHSGGVALTRDGSATLFNSRLAAFTMQSGYTHVIGCMDGQGLSVLTVDNSQILGTIAGSSGGNRGVDVYDCTAVISNSTITLTGSSDNIGVVANRREVAIDKTKIYSPDKALVSDGEATVKITNSIVQGAIPTLPKLILLNNYTDKNIPIPDR